MYYLTTYGVPIQNVNEQNWFCITDISVCLNGDLIDKTNTDTKDKCQTGSIWQWVWFAAAYAKQWWSELKQF